MNKLAIVRFLATELMGWEAGIEKVGEIEVAVWHKDGKFTGYYTDIRKPEYFDPFNDISHAFMIVEKIGNMVIFQPISYIDEVGYGNRYPDEWMVIKGIPGVLWKFVIVYAETPAKAITIAAAHALATPEQIIKFGL